MVSRKPDAASSTFIIATSGAYGRIGLVEKEIIDVNVTKLLMIADGGKSPSNNQGLTK